MFGNESLLSEEYISLVYSFAVDCSSISTRMAPKAYLTLAFRNFVHGKSLELLSAVGTLVLALAASRV